MTTNVKVSFDVNTQALKNAQEESKKLESSLRGAAKAGKLIGAGIAAAATAAGVAIKGAINRADELSKAAQKFGVDIQTLSGLELGAKLSDVNINQLGTALTKLNQEIANGGGKLKEYGINATNAEDALFQFADLIKNTEDPTKKAALAAELFGKRIGPQLIPFLNEGAEGLRKFREESDRTGNTIDEKTGKAAEKFNDIITRLGQAINGAATKLIASEGFNNAVNDLTNIVTSEEFIQGLEAVATGISTIASVAASTIKVIGDLSFELGKLVVTGFDGPKNAVEAYNKEIAMLEGQLQNLKEIYANGNFEDASLLKQIEYIEKLIFNTERAKEIILKRKDAEKQIEKKVDESNKTVAKNSVILDQNTKSLKKNNEELAQRFDFVANINDTMFKFNLSSAGLFGSEIKPPVTDQIIAPINITAEASQQALQESRRNIDEIAEYGRRQLARKFTDGILAGLEGGKEGFRNFLGNLARQLLQSGLDKIFASLFENVGGSNGSNFFNFIFGLFGGGSAKGNVFNNGSIIPFANGGIVNRTTPFGMSGGRFGIMGEAGPEAILPLKRGAGGRLGVEVSGANSGSVIQINTTVNVTESKNGQDTADRTGKTVERIIESKIKQVLANERRSGNSLNPAVTAY
jgi:hypothetical protein